MTANHQRRAFRNPGGRVFGPDGIFATRVYLDSWYVIGPFAGRGAHSMETAYPPEGDIDLDGVYPGMEGRVLAWRYASRGFYPFVPPDRACSSAERMAADQYSSCGAPTYARCAPTARCSRSVTEVYATS